MTDYIDYDLLESQHKKIKDQINLELVVHLNLMLSDMYRMVRTDFDQDKFNRMFDQFLLALIKQGNMDLGYCYMKLALQVYCLPAHPTELDCWDIFSKKYSDYIMMRSGKA